MVLEGFTKLISLDFGYVYQVLGLSFVKKDLNMAAIYFSHFKI